MNFLDRHLGSNAQQIEMMLRSLGMDSLDELLDKTVPAHIRSQRPLQLDPPCSETQVLQELRSIAQQNQVWRSYIGMGYANCITPPVIQRNILENPNWYTPYTPYQAEVSQGRLEALLNFQTMIMDLTGMEVANASLLDEGSACGEAMTMIYGLHKGQANKLFVSQACHPPTIAVVQTRALPLGIEVVVGDHHTIELDDTYFGVVLSYPATDGAIHDYRALVNTTHDRGGLVIVVADLLALTLLQPPGEWGADVVVGNTQRFGVPLGYGGPHAAFFATKEAYKRQIPGRIVGISQDRFGRPALRLALQTREQHIRRDKATSNICTAQALLAVMASAYGVYHGAQGLKSIAQRIHTFTLNLAKALQAQGWSLVHTTFFDTLTIELGATPLAQIIDRAKAYHINLRPYPETNRVGISLDETVIDRDIQDLLAILAMATSPATPEPIMGIPESLQRTSSFLNHPVFQQYHTETELLRYLHRLQSRDMSLATGMIPLGSCTMKLNATAEMLPVSWAEFNALHPFVPPDQARGYQRLYENLEAWLMEITGFDGISLQPNAGSQGEYAGLLAIRAYHQAKAQQRHICLIPQSAHGTNPASAVMAGMQVIGVQCDSQGNVDINDLKIKAEKYQHDLACLMVTYPSTHGVFEEGIKDICDTIHYYGGQVYMDGANLNALVGICRPAELGVDVCHLNLHKTFCIPHGGGGPGVGPIGVKSHLIPFLPQVGGIQVASAPQGSASILPIVWAYIKMMGAEGLTKATKLAILNANYIAHRLAPYYPILYTGKYGLVAHECIIDLRPCKTLAGVEVDDIAKRLMDYGFHAPTVSWPVAGTVMIEPTESESKAELDRFCDAMIAIRAEIDQIAQGVLDRADNPLKNAPHPAYDLICRPWNHPYSPETAAYPAPWLQQFKFWPPVARIDNAYGDRHFFCSCAPVSIES
jgi:glycine dehydrogenase